MLHTWISSKKYANKIQIATAWRVEGTLREFAKFKPVNMWFSYPVHALDKTGVLSDIQLDDVNEKNSPWKKNFEKKETKGDKAKKVETASRNSEVMVSNQ